MKKQQPTIGAKIQKQSPGHERYEMHELIFEHHMLEYLVDRMLQLEHPEIEEGRRKHSFITIRQRCMYVRMRYRHVVMTKTMANSLAPRSAPVIDVAPQKETKPVPKFPQIEQAFSPQKRPMIALH